MSVNCPYCQARQNINHDDGHGYDENELHQQECYKCRKTFVFNTCISFDYNVFKADCLNGAEHVFEPTKTFPHFLKKMRCKTCGEEHTPTPDERKIHNIPTCEQYLEQFKKEQDGIHNLS